ncbi:MAG: class I SAM-dependent methyltransferase [Xanthomonadales bacterium]|nr:class I SAM-dependent methyltransferase [Xanthomonadales bacterium]
MPARTSRPDTEPLFDQWCTYQKVVAGDYMHHRALFAALASQVGHDSPLRILDLGCGDAAPISGLLERLPVDHYQGIDQSDSALELASARLTQLGIEHRLLAGDMLETLAWVSGPIDLVVASFSLHHLQPGHKQAVLTHCRRLLGPGGQLALIDIFRNAGESRDDYLHRWESNARQAYVALSPGEMDEVISHVWSADFPESISSYRDMADSAGFTRLDPIHCDQESLNRLVILS